jgi:hypothetical protein
VARVLISDPKRRAAFEPLYEIDPRSGASIEGFYADRVLAGSFGTRPGWYWGTCQRGFLPDGPPTGPFTSSYAAYRDWDKGVTSILSRASTTAAAPITPW